MVTTCNIAEHLHQCCTLGQLYEAWAVIDDNHQIILANATLQSETIFWIIRVSLWSGRYGHAAMLLNKFRNILQTHADYAALQQVVTQLTLPAIELPIANDEVPRPFSALVEQLNTEQGVSAEAWLPACDQLARIWQRSPSVYEIIFPSDTVDFCLAALKERILPPIAEIMLAEAWFSNRQESYPRSASLSAVKDEPAYSLLKGLFSFYEALSHGDLPVETNADQLLVSTGNGWIFLRMLEWFALWGKEDQLDALTESAFRAVSEVNAWFPDSIEVSEYAACVLGYVEKLQLRAALYGTSRPQATALIKLQMAITQDQDWCPNPQRLSCCAPASFPPIERWLRSLLSTKSARSKYHSKLFPDYAKYTTFFQHTNRTPEETVEQWLQLPNKLRQNPSTRALMIDAVSSLARTQETAALLQLLSSTGLSLNDIAFSLTPAQLVEVFHTNPTEELADCLLRLDAAVFQSAWPTILVAAATLYRKHNQSIVPALEDLIYKVYQIINAKTETLGLLSASQLHLIIDAFSTNTVSDAQSAILAAVAAHLWQIDDREGALEILERLPHARQLDPMLQIAEQFITESCQDDPAACVRICTIFTASLTSATLEQLCEVGDIWPAKERQQLDNALLSNPGTRLISLSIDSRTADQTRQLIRSLAVSDLLLSQVWQGLSCYFTDVFEPWHPHDWTTVRALRHLIEQSSPFIRNKISKLIPDACRTVAERVLLGQLHPVLIDGSNVAREPVTWMHLFPINPYLSLAIIWKKIWELNYYPILTFADESERHFWDRQESLTDRRRSSYQIQFEYLRRAGYIQGNSGSRQQETAADYQIFHTIEVEHWENVANVLSNDRFQDWKKKFNWLDHHCNNMIIRHIYDHIQATMQLVDVNGFTLCNITDQDTPAILAYAPKFTRE